MTRALLLLGALGTSAFGTEAHAQRRAPQIQTGGAFAYFGTTCDCDERDFVFRTLGPVEAHTQPTARSRVVRTVAAGRLIEGNDWDNVVTVITSPARGTLTHPFGLVDARRMNDARRGDWDRSSDAGTVTIPAGTAVEVYSNYGGDGYARFGNRTYFGGIPGDEDIAWERGSDGVPAEETWFRLVARPDAPAAWIRVAWSGEPNVELLCETHGGCVAGFTPTYQPRRP